MQTDKQNQTKAQPNSFLVLHYFLGRLFDKDGNINSWFSRATTLGYIERQNCLAKQYSEFEVYGRKVG